MPRTSSSSIGLYTTSPRSSTSDITYANCNPTLVDSFSSKSPHLAQRQARHLTMSHTLASVPPIYRLPAELLLHVALMGTADSPTFPILLSHVSARLRTLVLRTPVLWSNLTLATSFYNIAPPTLIDAILERSKNAPLDIRLDMGPMGGKTTPWDDREAVFRTHLLMSFILPHIPRWRSLELCVPSVECLDMFLAGCVSPAPLLESISIFRYDAPRALIDDHRALFSNEPLPALQHLHVHGTHIPFNITLYSSPTLIMIHISNLPLSARPAIADFLRMLGPLRSLERLTLSCVLPINPPGSKVQHDTITLPSLGHLDLTGNVTSSAHSFLRALQTPVLKSMVLGAPANVLPIQNLTPLIASITKSKYPRLEKLRLALGRVDGCTLVRLQEGMKSLKWLSGPTSGKGVDVLAANRRWTS